MIKLDIQIKSLFISILFGILFAFLYKLNYKYLYKTGKLYKYVINFLFSVDFFLLFFIVLKRINNGVIHMYFLVLFFISYLFFNFLINFTQKKCKTMSKQLKIKWLQWYNLVDNGGKYEKGK